MSRSILAQAAVALSLALPFAAGCASVVEEANSASTAGGGGGSAGSGGTGGEGGMVVPGLPVVVSAHWDHVCSIDAAGALRCWGSNLFGELGIGGTAAYAEAPVAVDPAHRYRAVYAGELMTCALRVDGSLWCWGRDSATGEGPNALVPTRVGTRSDYEQVAVGAGCSDTTDCGASFVCAIRQDGIMDCYHGGHFGPEMPMSTIEGTWLRVASHWYATLAIRTGGDVWSSNNDGVFTLAVPGPMARVSPGSVDQIVVGSTGVLYRREEPHTLVPLGEHFGGPVSTSYHTCAITDVGALWCGDEQGQTALTQVGTKSDWIAIGTGASFSCGARIDASIWCWGQLQDGNGKLVRDYGPVPTAP